MNRSGFVSVAFVVAALSGAGDLARLDALEPSCPDRILLDGTWEILFDPENKGREAAWQRNETYSSIAGRRTIQVPSCWEEIEKDESTGNPIVPPTIYHRRLAEEHRRALKESGFDTLAQS